MRGALRSGWLRRGDGTEVDGAPPRNPVASCLLLLRLRPGRPGSGDPPGLRQTDLSGGRPNSCCGHPAPGEGMRVAVLRRLRHELGIVPSELELILPAFRYRATAADGTVENELCPVYRAVTTSDVPVTVHPSEVCEAWWVPWAEFAAQVDGPDPLSSWGAQQVEQLSALGPDPFAWPSGELALLPAAATP